MKRFAFLLLLVLAIPVLGSLVASFAKARSERVWFDLVKEKWGEEIAKKATAGPFSLEKIAQKPEYAKDTESYNNVLILRKGSLATIAAGIMLLLLIAIAGALAPLHRRLLLLLFAPGLKVVLLLLFGILLAQGAIATYSLFIIETTLLNRYHPFLIGAVGFSAAVGAASMLAAGFSISKWVSITVRGARLAKDDEPELWEFVEETAKKLNAIPPKNIVVGLEPTFYVTSAEVVVHPGGATYSNETLYLSLPFLRIFTKEELKAVIGHELGHFRGDDTKYTLKFYPVYAGTFKAIDALGVDSGEVSVVSLPGYAILHFFMDRFSTAESKISRFRELQADKAGSEAASSSALISALLKLGAFSSLWPNVRRSMIEALNKGKAFTNVSSLYAEAAVDSLDRDKLFGGVDYSVPHPTDSHPTISQRMESLGYSVDGFKATYVTPDVFEPAVALLRNPAEVEERISAFEHDVLLALGHARLPEAEEPPTATDDGGLADGGAS